MIGLLGADARTNELEPGPELVGAVKYQQREELLRLIVNHTSTSQAVAQ